MFSQITLTHQPLVLWVVIYTRDFFILSTAPPKAKSLSLDELSDEELVKLCLDSQRVHPHIFAILVRRHEGLSYRVALRYLRSDADADDATQDAFLKAFRGLLGFRQDAKFKTWLFKILHNVCMTRIAQRKRKESIEQAESDLCSIADITDTTNEYQQLIEKDSIQQTLAQLTEPERQILILRLIAELSLQEVADTLGLNLSATKMRFYRAQQHFADIYTQLQTITKS